MDSRDGRLRQQLESPRQTSASLPVVSESALSTASLSSNRKHIYAQFLCEHCGKEYSTIHHLETHQRATCNASKRSISALLLSTKEFWESRKRRRTVENPVLDGGNRHPADDTWMIEDTPVNQTTQTLEVPSALLSTSADSSSSRRGNPPEDAPSHSEAQDLDAPVARRKGKREIRLPARYRADDILPQPLPRVEFVGTVNESEQESVLEEIGPESPLIPSTPRVLVVHKSTRNAFGIIRAYRLLRGTVLTHDPDQALTLKDLTNPTSSSMGPSSSPTGELKVKQWGPFSSQSAFSLADWYWESKNKSFADFQRLITILKQPDFSLTDTTSVNWKAAFRSLGANKEDLPEHEAEWIDDDGWKTTPVIIDVPFHHRMRKPGSDSYLAGNLRHRNLVSVIKEKIRNTKDDRLFHYQPYKATWKPTDDAPDVELYGELYASRAFRQAHEEVEALPSTEENQGLERVVVAMMLWSDGTQLTSFGGASLWPCYLFFGNESKYRRCQPSEHLGEQVAYFIKLSDTFDDYLRERNDGKLPTDGLYAHCAREVFQKQWGIMLDDELVDAMKHGLVILCPDGKRRCFYPKIFTYSADYPEKQVLMLLSTMLYESCANPMFNPSPRILVAGLRNNGGCPCHRCLVEKSDLWKLAAPTDTERDNRKRCEDDQRTKVGWAREEIDAKFAVDGTRIDHHLKSDSLVPVHNAFSSRLGGMGFEIIPALVVDILHEFEIGAWKKLFIHLIRLLEAFTSQNPKGPTLTAVLDFRYRSTPHFGRDGIRNFAQNASEMKRRAARDYEDLLQCAIPAFDSLLPGAHNETLMKLLYICAQWHALAKLRTHHDLTIKLLEYTTIWLGAQMRLFNHNTCSRITTKELQKESEAREKREGKGTGRGSTTRKPVKFNMFTIKWHFLGDYPRTIQHFGTTDSYSTETGELYHRLPKAWFERTDKRQYKSQLSQMERRRTRLDHIRNENAACEDASAPVEQPLAAAEDNDFPDRPYTIGMNQNSPIDIACFSQNPDMAHSDPYLVNFIQNLKEHLLLRIVGRLGVPSSSFGDDDWINVALTRLYTHKLLRVNYTTYDVRRDQDVIHVGTPQSNVMLLNEVCTNSLASLYASIHPYLYAKVLGVYHANVSYIGKLPDGTQNTTAHRIEFVWVQWYKILEFGKEFALDRLSLYPVTDDNALGFLDPSDIIRSVHLIPQYSLGTPTATSRSQRSKYVSTGDVWDAYYINKFADRDLFMRYQYGMAVGHTYMRKMHASRMAIPSIPVDFEYYSTFPEGDETSPTDVAGDDEAFVEPPSDEEDGEKFDADI